MAKNKICTSLILIFKNDCTTALLLFPLRLKRNTLRMAYLEGGGSHTQFSLITSMLVTKVLLVGW